MIVVDIGCGERKYANAIGLDSRRTKQVDIMCDFRYLPIRDYAVDKVYASHVVEHIPHPQIKVTLREWLRILKKDGIIEIKTPNYRSFVNIAKLVFDSWDFDSLRGLFGEQDYEGNTHYFLFTPKILKQILKDLGVRRIELVALDAEPKNVVDLRVLPFYRNRCIRAIYQRSRKLRRYVRQICLAIDRLIPRLAYEIRIIGYLNSN